MCQNQHIKDSFNKIKSKLFKIPYVEGGVSYEGADCLGLVLLILKELKVKGLDGIVIDKRDPYSTLIKLKATRVTNYRFLDVILFYGDSNNISHCGLMLKDGLFIHSTSLLGVNIADINNFPYSRKLEGIYRLDSIHD